MSIIVGIDPGPVSSGVTFVKWDMPRQVLFSTSSFTNAALVNWFLFNDKFIFDSLDISSELFSDISLVSIEKIVAYGMSVSQATFDTAWWSGRFFQAISFGAGFDKNTVMISRPDVKVALYGATTYKDSTSGRLKSVDTRVLKECIHRFFEPTGGGKDPYKGTKHCVGPLYRVKGSHAWDALAVAVAAKVSHRGD